MISNELLRNLVELESRHSRFDILSYLSKSLTDKSVCLTHEINFIFSLQIDCHKDNTNLN